MKHHLVRVMREHTLNYQEYTTLLSRIEAILNSRPLCYKPGDPASIVLTSGHFLIGDQLTSLPEPESSNVTLSRRYDIMNAHIRSFWHAWSKDYLSQLKSRARWQKRTPNVVLGQVIILKDDMLKPAFWSLVVVSAVYIDVNGTVRTVDVTINGSVKRRAITSIVPLPMKDSVDPAGGE